MSNCEPMNKKYCNEQLYLIVHEGVGIVPLKFQEMCNMFNKIVKIYIKGKTLLIRII